MAARRNRPYSLGVDWHLPDGWGGFRNRPFATTTKATSDLIEALAADGHTVHSARAEIRFDPEAEAVLDGFINAGFGRERLARYVHVA